MAFNSVSDVLEPKAVSAYFPAELRDRLAFISSGAATLDLNDLAQIGGDTLDIRKFQPDDTAAELNNGATSTGAVVGSYRDIAVITRRKRVRGVDDSIHAALGTGDADAVNREIARVNGYYWSREMQTSLGKVISAHFDTTSGVLRSTHLNDISAATGTPKFAGYGAIQDTAKKLADNMDELSLLLVNNMVWADLKKADAAKCDFRAIGNGQSAWFYDGLQVFLTNQLPTSGSGSYIKYLTLLVRPGAFAFGMQREMQTYYQFNAYSVQEILTTTLDYCAHVRGVKWVGTASDGKAGATDTELATATNWTKVGAQREIGVAALLSNASV